MHQQKQTAEGVCIVHRHRALSSHRTPADSASCRSSGTTRKQKSHYLSSIPTTMVATSREVVSVAEGSRPCPTGYTGKRGRTRYSRWCHSKTSICFVVIGFSFLKFCSNFGKETNLHSAKVYAKMQEVQAISVIVLTWAAYLVWLVIPQILIMHYFGNHVAEYRSPDSIANESMHDVVVDASGIGWMQRMLKPICG